MRFQIKIALWMMGMMSLIFGLGGGILLQSSFGQNLDREEAEIKHIYEMTSDALSTVAGINGSLIYEDVADTLALVSGRNIQSQDMIRVSTPEKVIYQSDPNEIYGNEQVSDGIPADGIFEVRHQKKDGKNILAVSGNLGTDKEPVRLDIARDLSGLFRERENWKKIYQAVFLLLLSVCAIAAYTAAGILTRPLKMLSDASKRIAGGDLTGRAGICSDDEIGELGQEFNRMAEHLEHTVEQLKKEMESQERFMGNFSHELKTPMTSIIGYADLIRGGTLDLQEQAEAADYIVSEGKRLENLSMKLLDLLSVQNEKNCLVTVRPASVLEKLEDYLVPACEKRGIVLEVRTQEGKCMLEPDLFYSLLLNLADNAVKAMADKGGRLRIALKMTEEGCSVFVGDTGRGIPAEALKHLTEAFYRVDKARSRASGGNGLGLALCREIAKFHGGYLRFCSREGTGTAVMAVLRGGRSGGNE